VDNRALPDKSKCVISKRLPRHVTIQLKRFPLCSYIAWTFTKTINYKVIQQCQECCDHYGTQQPSCPTKQKLNQKQVLIHVVLLSRSPLVARPLLTKVARKLFMCQHVVFTSRMGIHLLLFVKHLAMRSCADKEVPNKTIHRLVTKLRDMGSVSVTN
jgi:hypothetical protein